MESHRRVVCLELSKLAHGVVVKRVTTRRCGSGQRRCRRQCVAMIMGLALQSLCVVYGAQPAATQVLGSTSVLPGALPRTGIELAMLLCFAALAIGTGALALRFGSRRREPLG